MARDDYLLQPRKPLQARSLDAEIEEVIAAIEETGEIRHLHGHPLDLSDDSLNWYMAKTLKREGFTHPLLERGREVDAERKEIDAPLRKLARRREWLVRPGGRYTAEEARIFNEARRYALDEYRENLTRLNIRIRDYNLGVQTSLQRRLISIKRAMEEAESAVLSLPLPEIPASPRRGFWQRLFGRRDS